MGWMRSALLAALLLSAPASAQTDLALQHEKDFPNPLVYTAADPAGHTFTNSFGRVVLWVSNLSGSPVTLTVESKRPGDIGPIPADYTIVIPAGELRKTPQFDPRRFTDPVTGKTTVTLTSTTGVSLAAVVQQTIFRD